jgi:hypothetical protein
MLLNREHSDAIRKFLNRDSGVSLFISDFSLYSIGIFLIRRKQSEQFAWFLDDLEQRDIRILSLTQDELKLVPAICTKHSVDFDDAYQYIAADQNHLKLVSLDHDFDRIFAGRVHPNEL